MSASRFRARTAGLLSAVLLGAAGLAAANVLQPPRIIAVESRPAALTDTDGANITIRLSQPIAAVTPADIRTEPEVPFTVSTAGAAVTLRLGTRLDYASTLQLTLRVTGTATGVRGELVTSLAAPDTRVTTLVRGGPGQDRFVSDDLVRGGRPTDFLPGVSVREYAMLPDRVVVLHDAGTPDSAQQALGTYAIADGTSQPVIRDTDGDLSALRADPAALSFGVVATGLVVDGQLLERALLVFDGRSATGAPAVVRDEAGAAISVADWRFVPGDGELVIRDAAGQSWRAHPLLGEPATRIPPDDPRALLLPAPDGAVTVSDGAEMLPSADRRHVIRRTADGAREWFAPPGSGSRVGAICAAPGGRFIAVEITSAEGQPDGRPGRPGLTHTVTQFRDARSGVLLRSLIGFAPHWC